MRPLRLERFKHPLPEELQVAHATTDVENVTEDHYLREIALIDPDGFRPNVGIILSNVERRLFWGRRAGENAWQFPQGGIKSDETPKQAMFRELQEEVGLYPQHVTLLGSTKHWLRYHLPRRFIRRRCTPVCIGQKQVWFMLRVNCGEDTFRFDTCDRPEFDTWRWVKYWQPLQEVVYFKRRVYRQALEELAPLLYPEGPPTYQVPSPSHHIVSRRKRV